MDEPDLGGPAARADDAAPRARVSLGALIANLELALLAPRPAEASVLAADAWGHGEEWVAEMLHTAGVEPAALDPAILYGLPGGHPDARPVLRLSGRVLSTKHLRAGEGVSYGYTHRAPVDTRLALVTGGYAQGIVRMLGNRVTVRIGGALRPLIGRVAMDVCVVDIGDLPVQRGDEVVFFGDPRDEDPPLAAWSAATGWSAGEIVALIGSRATREVGA